jgi:hypothetical protein
MIKRIVLCIAFISSFSFSGDSIKIKEYSKDSSGLEKVFHLANVCYPLTEKANLVVDGNRFTFTTMDGKTITTTIEEFDSTYPM